MQRTVQPAGITSQKVTPSFGIQGTRLALPEARPGSRYYRVAPSRSDVSTWAYCRHTSQLSFESIGFPPSASNFRDPDLAGQFAANEENRMSRNSPPWRRRGVFASYRFILNSSTSGSLNFVKQEKVTRKGGPFLLSLRSTSAHSGKHIDRWRAAAIRNPVVRE